MKIQNTEIEFVTFDAQDVIATSTPKFGAGVYTKGSNLDFNSITVKIEEDTNDGKAIWGLEFNPNAESSKYYQILNYSSTSGTIRELWSINYIGGSIELNISDVGTIEPSGKGVGLLATQDDVIAWIISNCEFSYQ